MLFVVRFGAKVASSGFLVLGLHFCNRQVRGGSEDPGSTLEAFPFVKVDAQSLALADAGVPEPHFSGRASSGRGVVNCTSAEPAALFLSREHSLSAEVVNGIGFLDHLGSERGIASMEDLGLQGILALEEVVFMEKLGQGLLVSSDTFGIGELEATLLGSSKSGGAMSQAGGEGDVNPHGVVVPGLVRCIQVACFLGSEIGSAKNAVHSSVSASATGRGKEVGVVEGEDEVPHAMSVKEGGDGII